MEERDLILEEVVTPVEDTKDFEKELFSKKSKNNFKKNEFKSKKCKVIAYNKIDNTLDVKFDKYGIRIKNVKDFSGEFVDVKYKGEIGASNFEYKL